MLLQASLLTTSVHSLSVKKNKDVRKVVNKKKILYSWEKDKKPGKCASDSRIKGYAPCIVRDLRICMYFLNTLL